MSTVAAQIEKYVNGELNENDEEWGPGEGDGWSEFIYAIEPNYRGEKDVVNVPGAGAVEFVEGETGGEGSGENIYVVFKVTDDQGNVTLFQKDGYYASFNGSDWDGDVYEVESYEKMTTYYRKKK